MSLEQVVVPSVLILEFRFLMLEELLAQSVNATDKSLDLNLLSLDSALILGSLLIDGPKHVC